MNCARHTLRESLESVSHRTNPPRETPSFARTCGTPSLRALRCPLPHNDLRIEPSATPMQNSLDPERHNRFARYRSKPRAIRPQLLKSPELPIIEQFRTDKAVNHSPPLVSLPNSRE